MRLLDVLAPVSLLWAPRAHAIAQQHQEEQAALSSDGLIVPTTSGIVHGGINDSAPLVRHWLGVPYAQQPRGDLRFQRPKALLLANASRTHVDATHFGPSCPQYEATAPSVYNKIIREFFIWGDSGDDCLTVSIWAPLGQTPPVINSNSSGLPVFIWIYGGGDTTGGSSVPYQNPQKWVQRTQAHVVVSLQYRLNFFGSPNGPGGLDGALGFWDTRMAMEWTRDNIAAFGGDPARMVLWGQSAGAAKVGQQSLAFLDDPIVWGYIEESGAAYGSHSEYSDTTHANWTFIADEFGCTGDAAIDVTQCLQRVPQADIEALIQLRVDAGKTPAFSFQSKKDNVTTFLNSTAAYLAGHYNKAPKILAHTKMDGASLVALPPYPYDTAPNATLELASTQSIRCSVVGEARVREALGLTTYRMMYSGNFSNISPHWWMGAYHSSELPLLFGTYGDFRGSGTDFEDKTSEIMQDYYLAFALDPESGLESAGWPKYSTGLVEIFGGEQNGTDTPAYPAPKGLAEDICDGYDFSAI